VVGDFVAADAPEGGNPPSLLFRLMIEVPEARLIDPNKGGRGARIGAGGEMTGLRLRDGNFLPAPSPIPMPADMGCFKAVSMERRAPVVARVGFDEDALGAVGGAGRRERRFVDVVEEVLEEDVAEVEETALGGDRGFDASGAEADNAAAAAAAEGEAASAAAHALPISAEATGEVTTAGIGGSKCTRLPPASLSYTTLPMNDSGFVNRMVLDRILSRSTFGEGSSKGTFGTEGEMPTILCPALSV
jgi:hypothetical protein